MITYEEVRRIFHYDPDTGIFVRVVGGPGVKQHNLNRALGCPGPNGQLRIGYKKRYYQLHRVIWLYMTGQWPAEQVDHINRNPSDNRWCNLRAATHAQNLWNQTRRDGKKRGAYFCKSTGRYASAITHKGKTTWLGRYDTAEEAARVYEEASARLCGEFHPFSSPDTNPSTDDPVPPAA